MMVPAEARTATCGAADARARFTQARMFLAQAEKTLLGASSLEEMNSVASDACLAGIAASDAICCTKLKRRSTGQSHDDALRLLATVAPGGPEMSKDLKRLLGRKVDAQYSAKMLSQKVATDMVKWARRLVEVGEVIVETGG
jgi:hypothetical protein